MFDVTYAQQERNIALCSCFHAHSSSYLGVFVDLSDFWDLRSNKE